MSKARVWVGLLALVLLVAVGCGGASGLDGGSMAGNRRQANLGRGRDGRDARRSRGFQWRSRLGRDGWAGRHRQPGCGVGIACSDSGGRERSGWNARRASSNRNLLRRLDPRPHSNGPLGQR